MNPDATNPERNIDTGPDGDRAAAHPEWALQADAAKIAGCSVSAIRKWRREGVIDDRRTTTTGGLERVEVRLADVLDRVGREPTRHVATADVRDAATTHPGTVIIPLSDLQTLILSLGEAERRAREASSQISVIDNGTQQLTASLASAETDLAAARTEIERHRRRIRELEVASAGGSHRAGAGLENERLREQVMKLEARMAESRSEVDGQRRRIRELETRQASPSQAVVAATAENNRLREQQRALEHRLTSTNAELERHRRRTQDLEARLATPSDSEVATDAENERLYKQMARLEARLAESGNEIVALRRRLREVEAIPAGPSEHESALESDNASLRDKVKRFEARLSTARSELDGQRRRIRELESKIIDQPPGVSAKVASKPHLAEPYDDARPLARSSAPSMAQTGQAAMVSPVKAVMPRGDRDVGAVARAPAPDPGPEPTAERLRALYHRLHGRHRRNTLNPDEQRRWIADLVAYDKALVMACIELGVPTNFEPGHRLPAAVRVELTRALREVGLDVAS